MHTVANVHGKHVIIPAIRASIDLEDWQTLCSVYRSSPISDIKTVLSSLSHRPNKGPRDTCMIRRLYLFPSRQVPPTLV
jgi:hypothetical protein